MAGKHLFEVAKPETQAIESYKALAKFPMLFEELLAKIPLANDLQLTLFSNKDCCYYAPLSGSRCKTRKNYTIRYHRRDPTQATREVSKNSEPGLIHMIQAAEKDARSKLELFGLELFGLELFGLGLFGSKPFNPVLE